MKRSILVGLLLVLLVPGVAQAELYMSKRDAASSTREVVRDRYGDDIVGRIYTICAPRGLDRPEPGYIYRYWTCTWGAEHYWDEDEMCFGRLRISGDRRHDWFRWGVQRGMSCHRI